MSEGIDLAEVAMINDMARLQVISNNLANISTTGYRRDAAATVIFESQLLELQSGLLAGPQDTLTPRIETRTVHDPGTLRFTGNPLDLAIESDAFFAIETPDGEAYSRQGAFRMDAVGQLVTAAGWPVLSTSGPVRLTTPAPRIDQSGRIWEAEQFVGQLKLVRFGSPETLSKAGGGYFLRSQSEPTTPIDVTTEALLRQSYLENSNVQLSQEMVKLLEVMRHFEAARQVIRGYDDTLDVAISTIADF
jgi:flagellar basal-body rod protein FlgG